MSECKALTELMHLLSNSGLTLKQISDATGISYRYIHCLQGGGIKSPGIIHTEILLDFLRAHVHHQKLNRMAIKAAIS